MGKEKIFNNLILSKEKTDTYYHVDGLSLQNLFFVNNNYFPNCYMFTYSGKNGSPHFDVYEILNYTLIKKHIKEVPNFSVDEQYNDDLKKGLTLADIYGFYEDSYEIERKKII